MHVPFQLRVPVDHATRLSQKLKEITEVYEKDEAAFSKRIKSQPHSDKVFAENRRMQDRKRKLTTNHMLRIVLAVGIDVLEGMSPDKIFRLLDADTVMRGRPRENR